MWAIYVAETVIIGSLQPSKSLALLLLGIIPVLYVVAGITYNLCFHPLRDIPGPVTWAGSNLPKIYHQCNGTIPFRITELHEKYGDVVRVAPNELSYISAWAWKEICGKHDGQPLPPNPAYGSREKEYFGALSLLWVQSRSDHTRHRNLIQENFSMGSLRSFQPTITGHIDMLIQHMHERAGQTVDIARWFNYTTFDIIGSLVFGEPFNCLKNAKYHPWIAFIFSRMKMMMFNQIIGTMGIFGKVIDRCIPFWVKAEGLAHVRLTKAKVDRRRASRPETPDFMTRMLDKVGAPGGISLAELYADSQILVMAGSETSATALAVATYYLLREPDAMRKTVQEVRQFSEERDITFESLANLPYLRAVVNESLRIHPPLPAGIGKIMPKGGARIGGHFIPAGVALQVPHWPAYRNSRNFVDADRFVPERWLCSDPKYEADNKAVFQPFAMGSHNCVGRPLAFMETHMILARLLWNFDIELMPESVEWNQQRVFLLYEKRPLNVVFTTVKRGIDKKCV